MDTQDKAQSVDEMETAGEMEAEMLGERDTALKFLIKVRDRTRSKSTAKRRFEKRVEQEGLHVAQQQKGRELEAEAVLNKHLDSLHEQVTMTLQMFEDGEKVDMTNEAKRIFTRVRSKRQNVTARMADGNASRAEREGIRQAVRILDKLEDEFIERFELLA